jgi:hypothetical protein
MRNPFVIAAVLAFVGAGAMAQQSPPAANGPQNSAINSANSTNRQVTAPVKGRNSFTQGEARKRIEAHGYADVTGLHKDKDGIWRGQATKNGTQIDVALDYQGNVVEGNVAQGSTGAATVSPNGAGR